MKAIIVCTLLCLLAGRMMSQAVVEVRVIDSITTLPIVNASLDITSTFSSRSFVLTGNSGIAYINLSDNRKDTVEILKVHIRHLSYEGIILDLFILQGQDTISIEAPMMAKPFVVDEIVISSKRFPYLIKGDTVIYDVGELSRTFDENLEASLKRFPGISVSEDGSLSYKDKPIQKILIDGQQIQNVNAAMITRSLSSDQVASVEIRLNEQEDQIVGSILERTDYVIMDIKLKSEVKKNLFGKLKVSAGTIDGDPSLRPGGMMNLFSLSKTRVHLIGEADGLGDVEIPLSTIRNMGIDEVGLLHELPSSFDELSSTTQYQEEFYPFKNYNDNKIASIGLSIHHDISESLILSFGSYNSRQSIQKESRNLWGSLDGSFQSISLNEQVTSKHLFSKNRIALSQYADNIHTDLSFTLILPDNSNIKDWKSVESSSIFDQMERGREMYINLKNELKFSSSSSLSSTISWIHRKPQLQYDLSLDQPLSALSQYGISDWQQIEHDLRMTIRDILINLAYNKKIGLQNLGLEASYVHQQLREDVMLKVNGLGNTSSLMALATPDISYQLLKTKATYKLDLGGSSITLHGGINQVRSPDSLLNHKATVTPYFKTQLRLNVFSVVDIDVNYERDQSVFHLNDVLQAPRLTDIQHVVQNNLISLVPITTRSFQMSGYGSLSSISIDLALAYMRTRSLQGRGIGSIEGLFTVSRPGNYETQYQLFSYQITKNFVDQGIKLFYEGGLLKNELISSLDAQSYRVNQLRYVHNIVASLPLWQKKAELNLDWRYYDLLFDSSLQGVSRGSNNFQFRFDYNMSLLDKWQLNINSIYYKWDQSSINTLDMGILYKLSKHSFNFRIFNAFNNHTFQYNTINNVSFNSLDEVVLPRSVRLSYTYSIGSSS